MIFLGDNFDFTRAVADYVPELEEQEGQVKVEMQFFIYRD